LKQTNAIAALGLLWATTMMAQTPSNKVALVIPNIYGPEGLTLDNPDHFAHFTSSFQSSFTPFNAAMARQLTSLPIPSPASGFTYSFDRTTGVYTRSAASLGPILTERAETIGKDKFLFGFSYQHFVFNSIDGVSLRDVPVIFQHGPTTNTEYIKDIITTDNNIDAQVGQFTSFLTYGITNRLDLSVAFPLMNVSLAATSHAVIQRIGTGSQTDIHTFGTPNGGSEETFSAGARATGIGDVVGRVKGTVVKWNGGGLAGVMDLRLPTGDEYNFLGSGALGVRGFAVASGQWGPLAPHANVGYEWNGDSVLAGNVEAGTKARLPGAVIYQGGVDLRLTPKMTFAADFFGERVAADRVIPKGLVAANNQTYPTIAFQRSGYSLTSGSAGFKINPAGNLIVTVNALFRLNHSGLHSKIVPLIGISYTL
jgi:hypothetical protein